MALIAGGFWFLSAPHSLDRFNDKIAQALIPEGADFNININHSSISWQSIRQPLDIQLEGITLNSIEGHTLASLKNLHVTANLFSLLLGEFKARTVTLDAPAIHIIRMKEGILALQTPQGNTLPLATFTKDSEGNNAELPFHKLIINKANIIYQDEQHLQIAYAKDSNVQLLRKGEEVEVNFTLPLSFETSFTPEKSIADTEQGPAESTSVTTQELSASQPEQEKPTIISDKPLEHSSIHGKAIYNIQNNSGTLSASLKTLNPATICAFTSLCNGHPSLSIPISGDVALRIEEANVKETAFHLSGENGTLSQEGFFADTIALDSLAITGKTNNFFSEVNIESFGFNAGELNLQATASILQKEDGQYVNADGTASNLAVNDLYRYWPQTLAPLSRAWVIASISDGNAPSASLKVRMTPADFTAEYFSKESIEAQVKVEGATITYLEGFPKATNVNGVVDFTGTTIDANITSGTILSGTKAPKGRFYFSDLNANGTPMEIDVSLIAPIQDIFTILKPPRFDILKNLPLNYANTTGTANAELKLAFDAFSSETSDTPSDEIDWGRVKYEINANIPKLNNISYDGMTLTDSAVILKANNDSISATLKGNANQLPLNASYTKSGNSPAKYTFDTSFKAEQLTNFGVDVSEYVKGTLSAKGTYLDSPNHPNVSATIDLTQAAIKVSEVGYKKPLNSAASLSIQSNGKKAGSLDLAYKAKNVNINAIAEIEPKTASLVKLSASNIRLGKTNLSAEYLALSDGFKLDVTGSTLDLSSTADEDDSEPMRLSEFPAIRLNIDIAQVLLPKGHKVGAVKGYIHCNDKRCEAADMKIALADNHFANFQIFREAGTRSFRMQCDDAGLLARSFDVADGVYDGTLDIRGTYDDSQKYNPLAGRVTITNFVEKDAPILGKILNLSSLTGLLDTLTGKGITFDKLGADFVLANDKVTINNLHLRGDSIGIIADGYVNLAKETLKVEGSLAPAYMLNSILSKIPLVGELLAGGEGEGLFAVNFTIKGHTDDPDVLVNPLSALTPGFTRKFFDIFDSAENPATTAPKDVMKEDPTPKAPTPTEVPAQPAGNPFGNVDKIK